MLLFCLYLTLQNLLKKRMHIERRIEQYIKQANKWRHRMIFETDDWEWVHIRKEHFIEQTKSNYLPREMVHSKPSKGSMNIMLAPDEYNVNTSFNVYDPSPFDYTGEESRTNPLEEWGNDGNHWALQIPNGPILQSFFHPLSLSLVFRQPIPFKDLLENIWEHQLDLHCSLPLRKDLSSNHLHQTKINQQN